MAMLPQLFSAMKKIEGSDMYISAGIAPTVKVHGSLRAISEHKLTAEQSLALVKEAMSEDEYASFCRTKESNFGILMPDIGRFRVSAFWQLEKAGMVIRRIETEIPAMDDLYLPAVLKHTALEKRGLVLVVGATGSGKSTTQAAMVGYRNQNSSGHILTIEDPIEFVHEHQSCIVTQREVGIDTDSFEDALKSSLRQAPDVILIGEIRSQETMEFALAFAETGHLCMATLHATNANQAIDRILHLVPKEKHAQLLYDLSLNLKAIVAQQLIPVQGGTSRRGAFEILLNSPLVSELIRKNELHKIKEVMTKSVELGMQTFDQALLELYNTNMISYTEALHHADSPNDLRLMIKLNQGQAGGDSMLDGITIEAL
ncbi:PilT/PilU family type 4a pilus ATPase [Moritella dasanensis]|uniref:PilT/PilU family type 4a pilus ATPase n=1 Tax=Moritella dasanensis TaxID=428031 RepID=UPI0002D5FDEA|nr:PilT/PilU family type 4a pilus ATPase [Moritella dasanensis]